ncbi:MBLC1-like protein [Mya arenaria]|uniref:Metallo-beta-lactamase domain-containing protein 1 n=1 Tax=Mya arenaria TaxID=6604 RepID=A0ABY7FYJ2_MYAAR|nr:MBLC1-like protein [Mya arenaria]
MASNKYQNTNNKWLFEKQKDNSRRKGVCGYVWKNREDFCWAGLKLHDLVPEKIDYVVCTHGHSDHVGNLNLFLNAIHIISHDICIGDTYVLHDFKQGIPYEIDDDVEVISTPGHTSCDVSVNVQTDKGQVCIAGDLFERLEDMEDYTLWQDNSENPALQHKVRLEVLKRADWIVPGHGPMFQVPNEFKQQPRMVMYESVTQEADDTL